MDEVNEMIQKASSFSADNLAKVGTKAPWISQQFPELYVNSYR